MARVGQQQIQQLHWAARRGDFQRVRELLNREVPVDATLDNWGDTALMRASGGGTAEVVRLLLERGANVNHQNEHGWTALMCAAFSGYAEVISVLLEYGADASSINHDEDTALDVAQKTQYGAPVGETPEERSEREQRFMRSIQLLLEAQAESRAV